MQLPFLDDVGTLNRLRYNCIGGMLPFGLGVLAGRYGAFQLKKWQWALSAVACCLLSVVYSLLSAQAWLWVPVAIIIAGIAFVKLTPEPVLGWLVWTGGVSAAMFVVHPALRKILIPISHRGDLYAGLLLYAVAAFVVSWLLTKHCWPFAKDEKPKPNCQ